MSAFAALQLSANYIAHITGIIGQSETSERIIQVLGCDDCTGLGNVKNIVVVVVVVVVARLGADVSNVYFDYVSNLHHEIDIKVSGADRELFR